MGCGVDRIDAVTLSDVPAGTKREKDGWVGGERSSGKGDALCGTVEMVVEVELVGASVDEQSLVGIHRRELEVGAGGIADKDGHLILVLAEEDAIVALAHGLKDGVIEWRRRERRGGR